MSIKYFFVFVAFLTQILIGGVVSRSLGQKGHGREPGIPVAYLAINALAFTDETDQVIKRRLELNWFNADLESHKVVLYNDDPTLNETADAILTLDPAFHPDEFYVTGIQLEKPSSEELGYSSVCIFPYWIRLEDKVTGKGISPPRCLKLEPSWMKDREEEFGDLLLTDLSMAETHDSAAYKDYEGIEDDNLATLAVYTQEESLLQQLQWGARSLDIRIGYYPTLDEKYWLVHGIIKVYPLSEGIRQVQEFLRNSGDIIIWNTGGFNQPWDEDAHRDLIVTLQIAFGTWWVKPLSTNWNTTLKEVWQRPDLPEDQGRMILTYRDGRYTDAELFFPYRHYTWGNVNDPDDLKAYLDREVANSFANDHHLWIAGCQMTPTTDDILFDKWHGLRDMADRVNRNVTAWWQTEYSAMKRVGTSHDFILSTDAVAIGIGKTLEIANTFDKK